MKLDDYSSVGFFYDALRQRFPYFSGVIQKQIDTFGDHWLRLFERELEVLFAKDKKRIDQAVMGYGKFALDSMKLQVKFQKTKAYDNKTYEEAASEVYQNKEYMFGLYLPGILLSHYLWRHHFLQHMFFLEKFLPLVGSGDGKVFYDIGVGTGFYSKEMLTRSNLTGKGFDLSPYSLEHTLMLLEKHHVDKRYETNLRNIIENPVMPAAEFLVSIEVLEHLENPQIFLDSLSCMLIPGGYGLISAAINAPNADHIYLYRNSDEVAEQLLNAGFEIVDSSVDPAYSPKKDGDLVPVNVAFIVTKR
ncbi:MAG: methyltransferase domain-containing protein [Sulfuricella sp.]|nr:methyltransferase domain-containing protein [Sulfuricella sp.]